MRGRLIGLKSWDRIVGNYRSPVGQSVTVHTVWVSWVLIYALNHVLMCMRSEMDMDFGFTKWNRCWVIGREQ